MVARSICQPIWRHAQRLAPVPGSGKMSATGDEKNLGLDGTRPGLANCPNAPGGVPPSPPTPHPSGERPWAAPAPGSSFLRRLMPSHHQMVPMHHLGAAPETQDQENVGR